MKKPFLIAMCFTALAACGGSSQEDESETRTIQVRFGEPASLSELQPEQRTVRIEFFTLIDGVEGNQSAITDLLANEDRSAWNGQTELAPGRYVSKVFLSQSWDQNLVQTDVSPAITGDPVIKIVSVASYSNPLDVVVGQKEIILDIAPADLLTALDDDGDGLSNLSEILGTTDPFKNDTDGDGFPDGFDLFPNISTEFGDADGDGVGDNADNCDQVLNPEQTDFDNDHQGDACDADDDQDGLSDTEEATLGSDPFLADTDGDEVLDGTDLCLFTPDFDQLDSDNDHLGDVCDPDDDNDGILDISDNCPFFASQDQTDTDGNGTGDVCVNDDDGDGVLDNSDNCRTAANSDQRDTDSDGGGDACDPDDDNDGLSDVEEETPGTDNLITNRLAADTDGDQVPDLMDNCRITSNPNQASNGDIDGEGDACDCNAFDPEIRTTDAVFVAPSGHDADSGARNAPVKTISQGIALAQANGKTKVYIAEGIYNETIEMRDGISAFGGFGLSFGGSVCSKSLYDGNQETNAVQIIGSSTPVVSFLNISAPTKLEGVTVASSEVTEGAALIEISSAVPSPMNVVSIEDSYLVAPSLPAASVTAVSVTNASPLIVNNVIDAGDSQESTAIALDHSSAPKIIHNTIHGGGSSSSSVVLRSFQSIPLVVNNILFTTGGISQKILFFEEANPSSSILVQNNLMFGEPVTVDAPKLYQDLNPTLRLFSKVAQVNDSDGNSVGGNFNANITLTSNGMDLGTPLELADLFEDSVNANYRLAPGSLAVDRGINPATLAGIQIFRDRDFNVRPLGLNPDLGAFEQ